MSDPSAAKRPLLLPLVLAALLGGCVSAGVVAFLDDDAGSGRTTTVVRQAPLSGASPDGDRASAPEGGLTAADIYRRYAPGVVFIRARVTQPSDTPFDPFGQQQRSVATGTGFVIDRDGDILTNNHVIDGATEVTVQFADKKSVKAKVVGTDPSTDIALLKVDPEGLELDPLPLGSSKDVRVGDPTVAIGNPFGLDRTLTTGVISALQREIRAPNGFAINNVIQTDAAINPGNSGGPLIDASGRVIGINSQIETGGGGGNGNVGIGFAVPIDTAKQILDDLKTTGSVQRAYLGVTSMTIDRSLEALDLPVDQGALVQSVTPGSPAAKAGIRAGDITAQVQGEPLVLGGDVITKVDGHAITDSKHLADLVSTHEPDDRIRIEVLRDGERKTFEVQLAERPGTALPG